MKIQVEDGKELEFKRSNIGDLIQIVMNFIKNNPFKYQGHTVSYN
jgi:hypothetical protein